MTRKEDFVKKKIKEYEGYDEDTVGGEIKGELEKYLDGDEEDKRSRISIAILTHHKWEKVMDILMEAENKEG